ncbi:hypothetical protein [Actinomyces haliotis]|uniref:hypothetical protein n=1 Tax=Actinomyces haliotis TaxID=1280843 RepID=UPI0018909486|nr:hypothetical protein [Actinomyces haliotis]
MNDSHLSLLKRSQQTSPSAHSWRRSDTLAVVILIAAALATSLIGIVRAPQFSPIDEMTHVDYTWRVMHGSFPHRGDNMTAWTLEEWTCHRQTNFPQLPACGKHTAADFNRDIENSNAWQPPLYYIYDAAFTRAAMKVSDADPVNIMRLGSGTLIGAGLAATYALCRMWNIKRSVAFAVTIFLLCEPHIATEAMTVTEDAAALIISIGALWTLSLVLHNHPHAWVYAAMVAFVAAMSKTILLSPVITMCAVLLFGLTRWTRNHDPRTMNAVRTMVAAAAAAAIPTLLWNHYTAAHTPAGWHSTTLGINNRPLDGLPFNVWLPGILRGYGFNGGYWVEPKLTTYLGTGVFALVAIVLTAAPWVGLACGTTKERVVSAVSAIGPFIAIFLVQFDEWIRENVYFPLPSPRYAASLIGATAIALAIALNRLPARWRWFAVAVCVVCVAASTLGLLGVTLMPSSS